MDSDAALLPPFLKSNCHVACGVESFPPSLENAISSSGWNSGVDQLQPAAAVNDKVFNKRFDFRSREIKNICLHRLPQSSVYKYSNFTQHRPECAIFPQ